MSQKQPRVAIVHDWLYGGGAELVVEQLHKLFPEAPIYTSFASSEWQQRLDNKVVTGYLQCWPFSKLRRFLPVLRQYWFKNLDLSDYDLVISSSGNGEAKFVRMKHPAIHICYCHTPTHFYWRKYNQYLKDPGFKPAWLARLGLKLLIKPLRHRDYAAARKVDYFIANSSHIQHDIEAYYGRESTVIYPPVNVQKFSSKPKTPNQELSFVMWGRHVQYKRFDLVIEACNQLNLPLTIIGKGPVTKKLKSLAGPTITFTGFIPNEEIAEIAQDSSAFIFPSEEDFGIAPVEAMSLGLPIVAYESGGALDYVEEGKTGLFFKEQSANSLISALKKFKPDNFDAKYIHTQATSYSSEQFRKDMTKFVEKVTKERE